MGGVWTYAASNLSVSGLPGVSCQISGVRMTLNQVAETFTGSTSGGVLFCSFPDEPVSIQLRSFTVVNGGVTPSGSIIFNFDTIQILNGGSISGNSMNGSTSWLFTSGGIPFTLSGPFSAAR